MGASVSASLLHVDVTTDDIAEGRRYSACYCPVARALQRALGPGVQTCVSPDSALLRPRLPAPTLARGGRWSLPVPVRDFVTAFDAGLPVASFAFDIDLSTLEPV